MTQNQPPTDRPLEETPEAEAAVEDETTVPQLVTDGGEETSTFREPADVSGEFPATEDLIGDAMGGGSAGPGAARTGAEQPWDAEDLAVAQGRDPTSDNVERARRELADQGPAAVERTVP